MSQRDRCTLKAIYWRLEAVMTSTWTHFSAANSTWFWSSRRFTSTSSPIRSTSIAITHGTRLRPWILLRSRRLERFCFSGADRLMGWIKDESAWKSGVFDGVRIFAGLRPIRGQRIQKDWFILAEFFNGLKYI